MPDTLESLKPWVVFAGSVLIVAVLYVGQAVLVPVTLSVLLVFLLSPLVNWFERWIGRVPAVTVVGLLTFASIGMAGWGFGREFSSLAQELPNYRSTIVQKVADLQAAGRGGSLERLQQTLDEVEAQVARGGGEVDASSRPVVVASEASKDLWGFPNWISPLLAPLSTVAIVVTLVMFMLLDRRDLRNRLLQLFAHNHLAVTTRALDEAAARVSRYLLMQALVNTLYGIGIAVGLAFIGVPYPLLWGCLGALLRFIPYVGGIVAPVAPLFISFATLPGWRPVLSVLALFGALELFTNVVLETVLYAGAAGVSQVALLVAVAFWTWLWGPLGLLMATPLTVCLVVLGKHVPGLEHIATLMSDAPTLDPHVSYYQRLLARDQGESADLIEQYLKGQPREEVYDGLLLPALNYAERDRLERRLTLEEEQNLISLTRELMHDVAMTDATATRTDTGADLELSTPAEVPEAILGYPVHGEADELALHMLRELLTAEMTLDIAPAALTASDLVRLVGQKGYRILCIADLPPSAPSKTRYVTKRLRAAFPDLRIVVGRWAPPGLADETGQPLLDAGATSVSTTLTGTCQQIREAMQRSIGAFATPER